MPLLIKILFFIDKGTTYYASLKDNYYSDPLDFEIDLPDDLKVDDTNTPSSSYASIIDTSKDTSSTVPLAKNNKHLAVSTEQLTEDTNLQATEVGTSKQSAKLSQNKDNRGMLHSNTLFSLQFLFYFIIFNILLFRL